MSGISSEASSSIDYFSDARLCDGHVELFVYTGSAGGIVPDNDYYLTTGGLAIEPVNADRLFKISILSDGVYCQNQVSGELIPAATISMQIYTVGDVFTYTLPSIDLATAANGDYLSSEITAADLITPLTFFGAFVDGGELVFKVPANTTVFAYGQVFRDPTTLGGLQMGTYALKLLIDDMQ